MQVVPPRQFQRTREHRQRRHHRLVQAARAELEMYRRNWQTSYASWKKRLNDAQNEDGLSLAPYEEQWRLMDTVHQRCVLEASEEQRDCINSTEEEPARFFGHGLPGSGKTQVMKWLAEYFQEVWGWRAGAQFVFLAPLNSMASRINGSTVHSWAEVEWKKAGPKGGMHVQVGSKNSQDMSSMAAKMELCRWLFVDEVEAVGAEILGVMEQHISEAARRRLYKFRGDNADPLNQRCFGGLNLCFFGDLWQLPPVLQVGISSNPFRLGSNISHQVRKTMEFFWGKDAALPAGRETFALLPSRPSDRWCAFHGKNERFENTCLAPAESSASPFLGAHLS